MLRDVCEYAHAIVESPYRNATIMAFLDEIEYERKIRKNTDTDRDVKRGP
tara:strand:+ start:231 stop:380 length:150 start_codon:yes stop_codon:yes gene_type:complete